MALLVLDLATVSGFCFGTEAGVIEHGTFKIPPTGEDYGLFLFHLRSWVSPAISRWQPEMIVYESPILPGHGNIHTLRKLYSMGPRVEEIARDAHVKTGEAHLQDIRRHFIGTDRAPKDVKCVPGCNKKRCRQCQSTRRQWVKDAVGNMCRKRGFQPADDNSADALALFSFAMSRRLPNFELLGNEIARAA